MGNSIHGISDFESNSLRFGNLILLIDREMIISSKSDHFGFIIGYEKF